jgi:type I restriction enzyme, S subunit
MSNLNFMEKLLDGVAVEWEALGKVLVRAKGTSITAGQMKVLHKNNAPLKVFAGGKTVAFVNFDDIPAKDISKKPSIIVKSRGFIEFEYYEKPFTHKNEMWSYHSNNEYVNIKFVYYFLKLNEPHFQSVGRKMQMPQISTPDTDKFSIPIPCPENPKKSLEIQAEIVRILDTFTELTTELTTRKKQYNYYRDRLLSFEDREVEWRALGDLSAIGDGLHGTPEYDDEGDYFFINGNNLDDGNIALSGKTKRVNASMFKKHGIIFTVESTVFLSINGTIGSVSLYNNEKIVLGKSVAFFCIKSSKLSCKYLFYFLQTEFAKKYFETQSTGSTIKNLGLKALRAFEIPLPSYAEQKRIVAILDKFEALTNSLCEGLPREIASRQKQYEYYRDLLLSFPKPEEAAT